MQDRSWLPHFGAQIAAGIMLLLAVQVVSVAWMARRLRREVAKIRRGADALPLATASAATGSVAAASLAAASLAAPQNLTTAPPGPAEQPRRQPEPASPASACQQAPANAGDEMQGVDPVLQELFRQNVDLQRKIRTLPGTDELIEP